jgi:Vacuolar protein sorting-associated protein 62
MPSLEWRLITITPRSSHTDDVASIWRPIGAPRYAALGDVLRKGCEPPQQPITMYLNCPSVDPGKQSMLEHPVHYLLVWRELAGGGLTVWRAQPPQGYRALGCLASRDLDPPPRTAMVCVREVRHRVCRGCQLSVKVHVHLHSLFGRRDLYKQIPFGFCACRGS